MFYCFQLGFVFRLRLNSEHRGMGSYFSFTDNFPVTMSENERVFKADKPEWVDRLWIKVDAVFEIGV